MFQDLDNVSVDMMAPLSTLMHETIAELFLDQTAVEVPRIIVRKFSGQKIGTHHEFLFHSSKLSI